jgi:hypothetical protein
VVSAGFGTAHFVRDAFLVGEPRRESEWWLVLACASLAVSFLLGAAFLRQYWKSHPVDRFLQWLEWDMARERREREREVARKRARRESLMAGEPEGTAFWTRKLAERLARLKRFIELDAPEAIIEKEQEMIRTAAANLKPAEALSVMRRWPELAAKFDRKARRKGPDAGPN